MCYSEEASLFKTELEKLFENKGGAVNYIFLTDLHYGSGSPEQSCAIKKQVEITVSIANTVDEIDFIVIGGDVTTGMFGSKSDALKYTREALSSLKSCKKPVFILMGNHDDNSYHRYREGVYYPDRILSDKDWCDGVLEEFCPVDTVHDSIYPYSKYYYYDFPSKKTRIICLDAVDYRAEFDKDGNIQNLPIRDNSAPSDLLKYWSGNNWWGYSQKQIRWLAQDALNAEKDWNYVFFSHMGIDKKTASYGFNTLSGDSLRELIGSFQTRSVYKDQDTSVDFKDRTGHILSYQFGHIHNELTLYSIDLNLWQICTSSANAGQCTDSSIESSHLNDKSLDWKIYERKVGTNSSYCFDIMSVSQKSIDKMAFGVGCSKKLEY